MRQGDTADCPRHCSDYKMKVERRFGEGTWRVKEQKEIQGTEVSTEVGEDDCADDESLERLRDKWTGDRESWGKKQNTYD